MSPREPPQFPPDWADAWGDDRFGLWSEFSVAGVVQRMRWIEPGLFCMGSTSESDLERPAVEGAEHLVRITQGFWLSDSACSQNLWHSVMGNNPSHFKDDSQCPVERVSWSDVKDFFAELQKLLPEITGLVLPTEAQWEYACRAGTDAAFSFGACITPDQVNCFSYSPYHDGRGKSDVGREKTVPVKSLPPNAWGLYEMHGNVGEWCEDGMRPYPTMAGVLMDDPRAPMDQSVNAKHVVRGGGWLSSAKQTRSAHRMVALRRTRSKEIGFRFVLSP